MEKKATVNLDQVEDQTSNFLRQNKTSQPKPNNPIIKKAISSDNLGESQYSNNFQNIDESGIHGFFEQAQKKEQANESRVDDRKQNRIEEFKGKKKSPQRKRWHNLSEREREDQFLRKQEENEKLKKKITQFDNKVQVMNTEVHVIQKEYSNMRKGTGTVGADQFEREIMKDNEELKTKNKRLEQKMMALLSAKQVVHQSQPKQLYQGVGSADPHPVSSDSRKMSDLLQLIDQLNARLKISDQTIRSMQKNQGATSMMGTGGRDMQEKNIQLIGLQARFDEINGQFETQREELGLYKQKVIELNKDLSHERDETNRLKIQLRSFEIQQRNSEDQEKELEELRREKNNLEKRLNELARSPFFSENNEKVASQTQLETTKLEKVKFEQENKYLKEACSKMETELELKKKMLQELNNNYVTQLEENASLKAKVEAQSKQMAPFRELQEMDMDTYLKALGNVKWKGQEPKWRNLQIVEREKGMIDADEKDLSALHREIETLKLERSELAAHLEKTQTLLNLRIEIEQDMEKSHKAEIDKLNLQLKTALAKADELAQIVDIRGYSAKEGGAIVERNGIQYDDTVSEFSVDPTDDTGGAGSNLFDLHVGKLTMMEETLLPVSPYDKPSDLRNVLTFITVDFYDHETQHSGISEGLMPDVNLQLSFKVVCDEFFITYLESGFIRLELFIAKGAEPVKVASANIPLVDLILKNQREGISSVIKNIASFKCISASNQIIASAQFTMRMRKPITETLKWLQEQKLISIREDEEEARIEELVNVRQRNLMLIVERAEFINSQQVNSFVYFSLQGNDFHSSAVPGDQPKYDFRSQIQIFYDEKFISFLRHNTLAITFFDDSVEDTSRDSDIIGTANVKLEKLVSNSTMDLGADIISMGKKAGTVFLKAFWFDGVTMERPKEESLITRTWESDITLKIAQKLKSMGQTMQTAFMLFDRNGDKIVSFEEFTKTVMDTLGMKMNREEVELYYKRLQQPFNYPNFEETFANYLLNPQLAELSNIQNSYLGGSRSGVAGLKGMLNENTKKLMSITSDEASRIKSIINELFSRKLKRMHIKELFQEIDRYNQQKLSLSDVKEYLRYNNIGVSDNELFAFLQYVDEDNDNLIDIDEFYGYIVDQKHRRDQTEGDQDHRSDQEIVTECNYKILNFMAANNLTFTRLHDQIDLDRNGKISRGEFAQFFNEKLHVNLSPRELSVLFNHYDTDRSGVAGISMEEFLQGLQDLGRTKSFNFKKDYAKLYVGERYELNEELVREMAQGMKARGIKLSEMFNRMDKNNDGWVDRREFMHMISDEIFESGRMNETQINNLFDFFDQDASGQISINEFVKIMQPQLEEEATFNYDMRASQSAIASLQEQLQRLVQKQYSQILQYFRDFDLQKRGVIAKKDFLNVLQILNELTLSEREEVYEQIAPQDLDQNVDYIKFLDQVTEMEEARVQTQQIFNRIAEVLQNLQMDRQKAFDHFDTDKDQTISQDELFEAFSKMQIPVSVADVEQIIAFIDRSGDGKIQVDQFLNALDL